MASTPESPSSELPYQPPKEAVYNQSINPVTQTPAEQSASQANQQQDMSQTSAILTHQYGSAPAAIRRSAASKPSADEVSHPETRRGVSSREEPDPRGNIDTEYGVEQQPNEGAIATAVRQNRRQPTARNQAGAHAGPVGSATSGPGVVAGDTAAQMERKKLEHDKALRQRKGNDSESSAGREKSGEERSFDVKQTMKERGEVIVQRQQCA